MTYELLVNPPRWESRPRISVPLRWISYKMGWDRRWIARGQFQEDLLRDIKRLMENLGGTVRTNSDGTYTLSLKDSVISTRTREHNMTDDKFKGTFLSLIVGVPLLIIVLAASGYRAEENKLNQECKETCAPFQEKRINEFCLCLNADGAWEVTQD